MKLEDLIIEFRAAATDEAAPYLFSDEKVTRWLNDAQCEAVIRRRLIHESELASVCEIDVAAGTSVYDLHPALYEIDYLCFSVDGDTEQKTVRLISGEEMDAVDAGWRSRSGTPIYAIQGDTRIRLVPRPDANGTLKLEGFRLPIDPLVDDADEPEIHQAHHRFLIFWALHRAFSSPDSESIDPAKAADAERDFTDYFGLRPDADLRRDTRTDVPQVVKGFMP